MIDFKPGDVVKDKVSGQIYNILLGPDEKEDVFCKRTKDGLKGWKYSAELQLVKRTP